MPISWRLIEHPASTWKFDRLRVARVEPATAALFESEPKDPTVTVAP